jgi:hypothetical protein
MYLLISGCEAQGKVNRGDRPSREGSEAIVARPVAAEQTAEELATIEISDFSAFLRIGEPLLYGLRHSKKFRYSYLYDA